MFTPNGEWLAFQFVDGIETESNTSSAQRFEFSSALPHSGPPSPSPVSPEQVETRQSISKLSEEMTNLSQQVSQLSQELQEMTHLLRPLFLTGSPALLSTLPPSLTPPPSSTSGPSISFPAGALPHPAPPHLASPCSPLRIPCSLLDRSDAGGMTGLPSCLIPTSPQRPQAQPQMPVGVSSKSSSHASLPQVETVQKEQPSSPLGSSNSNGFGQQVPDRPPLASRTPSPSLSFSLSFSSSRSQSPSFSPCQGPHPSRPSLAPPPSQEVPPPLTKSHCSAPASLSSSPGSSPWFQQTSNPSHLGPGSGSGSTQPPTELEMQEWDSSGRSSVEHISYIDEEGPPL
ncbi:hypothetical protein SRHO_G00114420 [Serrasalmus rhombeus]